MGARSTRKVGHPGQVGDRQGERKCAPVRRHGIGVKWHDCGCRYHGFGAEAMWVLQSHRYRILMSMATLDDEHLIESRLLGLLGFSR